MKLLAFCLLLGMSAQAQTTNLTATTVDTYQTLPLAYTFADGYCSLGEKIEISHGNGDKETLATCGTNGKWWKFEAADETDGKPPKCVFDRKNNARSYCYCEGDDKCRDYTSKEWAEHLRVLGGFDDGPPHKPWDEVDGMCGGAPPHPCNQPPADPVDVPAVQETHERMVCTAQYGCINAKGERVPEPIDRPPTCTDKSRVLRTSEDGKKHCIKFPEAK